MRLEDKKAVVAEVEEVASKALALVAAHYRGISVAKMNALRTQARQQGVYLRVVRNTLAKRAVANTEFACIQDSLVGPLLLAFSIEEPGSAARLVRDFSKECELLKVQFLAFDGQLMAADALKRLASLPTREEALAKLMAVMKAPISKFVRTLQEPHAKFVRTLAAVRDQKQSG